MGNQVYYTGYPEQGMPYNPYMYYQNPIRVNPNIYNLYKIFSIKI